MLLLITGCLVVLCIALFIGMSYYVSLNRKEPLAGLAAEHIAMMSGKIAVVVGATSGVGRVVAFEMLQIGMHVEMVVRNEQKAEKLIKSWKVKCEIITMDILI